MNFEFHLIPMCLPPDNDPMNASRTIHTPCHYRLKLSAPASRHIDRTTATGRNHDFQTGCSELSLEYHRGEKEMVHFNIVTDIVHRQSTSGDRVVARDIVEARSQVDAPQIGQQHDGIEEKLEQHQLVNSGMQRETSIKDSLSFCKKHAAVLESIKFKGQLMRAFEQESGISWFDHPMYHDDPPSSPLPKSIRSQAEELLKEFTEDPL